MKYRKLHELNNLAYCSHATGKPCYLVCRKTPTSGLSFPSFQHFTNHFEAYFDKNSPPSKLSCMTQLDIQVLALPISILLKSRETPCQNYEKRNQAKLDQTRVYFHMKHINALVTIFLLNYCFYTRVIEKETQINATTTSIYK